MTSSPGGPGRIASAMDAATAIFAALGLILVCTGAYRDVFDIGGVGVISIGDARGICRGGDCGLFDTRPCRARRWPAFDNGSVPAAAGARGRAARVLADAPDGLSSSACWRRPIGVAPAAKDAPLVARSSAGAAGAVGRAGSAGLAARHDGSGARSAAESRLLSPPIRS